MGELTAGVVGGGTSVVLRKPNEPSKILPPILGGGPQVRYGTSSPTSPWSLFVNTSAITQIDSSASRFAWELTGGADRQFAGFNVAARAGYAGARIKLDGTNSPLYFHGLVAGAEVYTTLANTLLNSALFDIGVAGDVFFVLHGDRDTPQQFSYQLMLRYRSERLRPSGQQQADSPDDAALYHGSAGDRGWHQAIRTLTYLRDLPERGCTQHNMFVTYEAVYNVIDHFLTYANGFYELTMPEYHGQGTVRLMSLNTVYNVVFKNILGSMEMPQQAGNSPAGAAFNAMSRDAVRKLLLDTILDDLRGTDILSRQVSGFPCLSLSYYLLSEGTYTRENVVKYAAEAGQVQLLIDAYKHQITKTERLVAAIETEFKSSIDAGARKKLDDVKTILSCLRNGGAVCEPRLGTITLPALRGSPVTLPQVPTGTSD